MQMPLEWAKNYRITVGIHTGKTLSEVAMIAPAAHWDDPPCTGPACRPCVRTGGSGTGPWPGRSPCVHGGRADTKQAYREMMEYLEGPRKGPSRFTPQALSLPPTPGTARKQRSENQAAISAFMIPSVR